MKARQTGLTLVELLITLVLSLAVMAAAGKAYLATSQASRLAEARSRMSDEGMAALSILSQHIRLAGDNPVRPYRTAASQHNPMTTTLVIRGCDIRFANGATVPMDAMPESLTCNHTASSHAPAAVVVRYEADTVNTVPLADGITPSDCVGTGVSSTTVALAVVTATSPVVITATSNVNVYVAENLFYAGTSTKIITPSLYCRSNRNSAQPMVENIEDLQFQYGVTTPASTTSVAGYMSAYELETSTAAPLAGIAAIDRWPLVKTVRICVLARSAEAVAPDLASASYIGCNGNLIDAPDLRLRRAYSTTVVLRNSLASQ